MKYCSSCGQPVSHKVPADDNLPRYVCDGCGRIHYQNPRLVVGCVPELDGRILLCRRAIEPRRGFWTVPAGFLENGEPLAEGAARETREEALAEVDVGALFAVVDVVHAHQVHVFYRATLQDHNFGAGLESLEVALFEREHIPWNEISFPSVDFALRRYCEDAGKGTERLHTTIAQRLRV